MKKLEEIEALLKAAGERPSVPCCCNAAYCGGARGPVHCPCICHRASVALSQLRQRAPEGLAFLARLVRKYDEALDELWMLAPKTPVTVMNKVQEIKDAMRAELEKEAGK